MIKNLSTYRKESEAVITHRCRGSLKAGVSIRYEKGWYDSQNAWWMWKPVTYDNWSTTVFTPVAEIRFCPFCGQKLEAPEQLTDKEQRIFLAAMGREEKVCKQVDEECRDCREAYEDGLVKTCHEIIRKVKGALWT